MQHFKASYSHNYLAIFSLISGRHCESPGVHLEKGSCLETERTRKVVRSNALYLSCGAPWRLESPFLWGLQGQLWCQALEQGSPRWCKAFNMLPFWSVLSLYSQASTTGFEGKHNFSHLLLRLMTQTLFLHVTIQKTTKNNGKERSRDFLPVIVSFFIPSWEGVIWLMDSRGGNDFRKLLSVAQLSSP